MTNKEMILNTNEASILKGIREKFEEMEKLFSNLSGGTQESIKGSCPLEKMIAEGLRVARKMAGKNEIFIKNVLNVDVDALKGINRYTVKAMYDVEQEDGSYKIEHRLLEDLEMTWDEIEEEGGVAEVNKQLRECYNV